MPLPPNDPDPDPRRFSWDYPGSTVEVEPDEPYPEGPVPLPPATRRIDRIQRGESGGEMGNKTP